MTTGGVIVGRYRLLRRLGAGGMAEAFEAEPMDEGRKPRRVCVKRLLPAQAEDPELREAFHREAHLLESLDHTKIVRVLDHFGDEGSECVVLELVNGVDLRALLAHEGRPLPPAEVGVLAVDLLRALAHAHLPRAGLEGIVHRDVSASNVLVSVDGEVRLSDFGIAKELEGKHAAASTGIKGKIPYMAPEQIRGERTSAQTDLFSLGVVLYEALAGRRPFDGAHDVETMTRVLGDERAPIAELAEGPPVLLELVEALLSFDPHARPVSAAAALEAFGELVEEPVARLALGARAAAVKPTLRTYTPLPFVPSEAASARLSQRPEAVPTTRSVRLASAPRWGRRAASRLGASLVLALGMALVLAFAGAIVGSRGADHAPRAEAARLAPALSQASPSELEAAPRHPEASQELPEARAQEQEQEHQQQEQEQQQEQQEQQQEQQEQTPQPPAPQELEEGTLRVVVIPWGNVWIDGAPRGRAPRVVRLPPGKHWVGAGTDSIEKRRRVVVRSGAASTVELDLSGG